MTTSHTPPVSPAAPQTPATAPASAAKPGSSFRKGLAVATIASVLFVVGALGVTRFPLQHAVPAAGSAQSAAPAPSVPVATAQPDAAPAPAAASVSANVADGQTPKAVVEKPRQARIATSPKRSAALVPPPAASRPAASGSGEPAARAVASEPAASAPAAESHPQADDASQAPVTITGCLEIAVDGDRFRLTDTEGANAPKARSWRSGFLKKRTAPVELVDLPDASSMKKYVGHRVAATGLLTSGELRVRSLESTGACN